jgi:hypothetical protein
MVYGGTFPTLTASYSGFVNGDTPASLTTQPPLGTTATPSSHVGVYPITASGAVDANYIISYVGGTLTVTQAALTITADSQSMVYGGTFPTLTASYSGLVNGDTSASLSTQPTLSTTATPSSPVGNYPITASGAVDPDYSINYVSGTLTVTPAPLTITADSKIMIYGGTFPTLTVSYSGFVNGDSAASLTTQPTLSTTATPTSPMGSYPITASGAADSNYTISYVSGTLTVTLPPKSAYILNPKASGAVTASGNASLKLPGGLVVDSGSPSAVLASGNAQVNVGGAVLVVGGVSTSGNAAVTKTGIPPLTNDPLSALPLPGLSNLNYHEAVNVSGNSSVPLSPGIYPSIQVSGHGSVTLGPGIYIIEGGGLSVSGNGSLTGDGVLIFNGGSAYDGTSDGGTYGSISLGGGGTISLSGPTSAPYAGVVIFQSRSNNRALALGGNAAEGITSIVYAPAAAVGLSGNAQLTGALVADTLSVSGNAGAFQLSDGASSAYAASTANWITNGVLTVAAEDDTGNGIDPNEIARISDAMAYLNQALGSFGVSLSWAAPGTSADVHIHFASSTPEGGAADGVIGFTTASNDVYFVTTGWSYYTGSDASAIGSAQYDFLTLATHELAHTVGLGESSDPSSVLYEYLAPGTVRRTFTDDNLALIDTVSDRFMKAALPVMHGSQTLPGQAASVSLFSPESALLLIQGSQVPLGGVNPLAIAPRSSSPSVLVGGAGHDVVIGGQGHNLLLGGFGHSQAARESGAWATDLVLSLVGSGELDLMARPAAI